MGEEIQEPSFLLKQRTGTVPSSAENFLLYKNSQLLKDGWASLAPFFKAKSKRDASVVAACRALATQNEDKVGLHFVRQLERMGPRQRMKLPNAVKRLRWSRETTQVYQHVEQQMRELAGDFQNIDILWNQDSDQFDAALLNAVPPMHDYVVRLVIMRMYITITKLLERQWVSRSKRTSSIETLLRTLQRDGFRNLSRKLLADLGQQGRRKGGTTGTRRWTGLRHRARKIIEFRNEHIAHLDIRVAKGHRKGTAATLGELRTVHAGICRIMNQLLQYSAGISTNHGALIGGGRPALAISLVLRGGNMNAVI